MNKEFTSKSSLTSFCAESSEKNFNGLPGNKGHSNTAGGKSGAAHQRDWYFTLVGRVALYVSKALKSFPRSDVTLDMPLVESVWVDIATPKNKKSNFCWLYLQTSRCKY